MTSQIPPPVISYVFYNTCFLYLFDLFPLIFSPISTITSLLILCCQVLIQKSYFQSAMSLSVLFSRSSSHLVHFQSFFVLDVFSRISWLIDLISAISILIVTLPTVLIGYYSFQSFESSLFKSQPVQVNGSNISSTPVHVKREHSMARQWRRRDSTVQLEEGRTGFQFRKN